MSGRLQGKRVVITGAASGIGLATARRFVAEGARVGLLDINEPGLAAARAELGADGTEALTFVVDVSSEPQVEAAMAQAAERMDGIDVVVANAAAPARQDARVHELPLEIWERTLSVNLTGTFLTCKYGIRGLLAGGGGTVICTASTAAIAASSPGAEAYSASKGGVLALMRVMAVDYAADGIRVNAIIPGLTETPLVSRLMGDPEKRDRAIANIPLRRAASPHEIAAGMVFLASDEASFVTGAALVIDGGWSAA